MLACVGNYTLTSISNLAARSMDKTEKFLMSAQENARYERQTVAHIACINMKVFQA